MSGQCTDFIQEPGSNVILLHSTTAVTFNCDGEEAVLIKWEVFHVRTLSVRLKKSRHDAWCESSSLPTGVG